jgi:hypothetical protein
MNDLARELEHQIYGYVTYDRFRVISSTKDLTSANF